jgi:hypothetical protein
LPEAEFLEIYNRSSNPFDLSGWKITDGTSTGNLSSLIILPGSYLILTATTAQPSFSGFGTAMGVASFPSLNNSSDVIKLINAVGKTIDSVSYSLAWYGNKEKEDGGWSLELIDPDNVCKGDDNWNASADLTGGTPGRKNSTYQSLPDLVGPKLVSVFLSRAKLLTLEFDERLRSALPPLDKFTIEPPVGILAASFAELSLTKINLVLAEDLDSTQTYSITSAAIMDCSGNAIQPGYSRVILKLDNSLPYVKSVNANSSTELSIVFSENVSVTSAENVLNYRIIGGGNPVSASLQPDKTTLKLLLSNPLTNGTDNIIEISNIKDLTGNSIQSTQKHFVFFHPVPATHKSIIISEIFADPDPQVNLPEAEFVELFNRSTDPFDLKGWTFTDGSVVAKLPSAVLLPHEYVILCSSSKTNQFVTLSKTLSTNPFPSLNNSGDVLVLKDPNGLTIDSVKYSDSWYDDNEKRDGGWSLEIIDPENTCAESGNWTAAEDASGGTPGKQNSVFANKPDNTGPQLVSVFPVSDLSLILQFNEKLSVSLPSPENFSLEPKINVSKVSFVDETLRSLKLTLAEKLEGGLMYNVQANEVYDCPGNIIQAEHSQGNFALPEKADSIDVVVNEVLFNPRPTGVDFVELFNKSSKFINLKNWKLGNSSGINKIISEKDFLLAPSTYVVFTEDGNVLKGEYLQGREDAFMNMPMPSLSDDEGVVSLISEEGKMIDSFSYSAKLHSKFIKEEEGVSLERISVIEPTGDPQNWKSASSASGYATPGYVNSNARTEGLVDEGSISVQPEIFMPMYGQPDFTQIKFNFNRGGFVANVKIVDPQGREIKKVANNELLGTEGFFRWDGDQENGSKARIGSYMVWFEIFDSSGMVKTFRKRVVIADKF